MSESKILFILTGSVAAAKACTVISALTQRGHQVRTVATAAALKFIGPATLEALSGQPVRTDLFAPGEALDHIELSRWADLLVVCPVTAHSLNRFAAGLGEDLAGALLLARDRTKPLIFAPAMNPAMWSHPATQAAVARWREWGADFVAPESGRTACGETGEGRMAEPETILAAIEARLSAPVRPLRVLVTSGATSEPLDGIRILTNSSSGRTGADIAGVFARAGHRVTLLHARSAPAAPAARNEVFHTYAELDAALTRLLGGEDYDVVIHAAAVGDFGIGALWVNGVEQAVRGGKLDSGSKLLLELRPQPKLLDTLRERSRNPGLAVVAFKLTDGATPDAARQAVDRLFNRAGADVVVHNDESRRGTVVGDFPATIHRRSEASVIPCATRGELAAGLLAIFSQAPITQNPVSHAPVP